MRPIDADELKRLIKSGEYLIFDSTTENELCRMIDCQDTVDTVLHKLIEHYEKLSNEYMQKAEHYRGMALAYATAADAIKLAQQGGGLDGES